MFKNWYLLGVKKKFKPRPQNRILVSLRGSFKNFDEHPRPFYMGLSPGCKIRIEYLAVRYLTVMTEELTLEKGEI